MTQEQIDDLAHYKASAAYDELQKLVIEYAEELTKHVSTAEQLMTQLKTQLSEQELVELNLIVGLAQVTNRFNESFKIDLDV